MTFGSLNLSRGPIRVTKFQIPESMTLAEAADVVKAVEYFVKTFGGDFTPNELRIVEFAQQIQIKFGAAATMDLVRRLAACTVNGRNAMNELRDRHSHN